MTLLLRGINNLPKDGPRHYSVSLPKRRELYFSSVPIELIK